MMILLLISYANIYLKTSILYCIVLKFNIFLTFKLLYHIEFEDKSTASSTMAVLLDS